MNEGNFLASAYISWSEGTNNCVSNWVSTSRTDKSESFYAWVVLICPVDIDQGSKYFGKSIKQKQQNDNHNGGKGFSNVDVLSMWQMQLGKWNSRWFISEWRGRWTQSWFRHLLSRMWWKHYFRKKETVKETIFLLSLCINCLLGNYSSSKSQWPWFLDDLTWYARRNIWYEIN